MEPSRTQQKVAHDADRRVRELYRYYQPLAPSGVSPSWLATTEELSSSASTATPSNPATNGSEDSNNSATSNPATTSGPETLVLGTPNSTLTSFAQLAALRLDVERARICVLDRDSQYMLAEATRSINLNDPSVHDSNDQIWPGCTDSHKAWNLCLDTVSLAPSDRKNAHYEYLIVNDLTENERFARLPFVEGGPQFRFYAGTPLTTENHINMGCFFVLDTKPRNGLTTLEKDTLGSLAALVVDYLKVSRQASEGRRAARLSRGLAYFVEGSSSFVESTDLSRASSSVAQSPSPACSQQRISVSGGSRGAHSPTNARSLSSGSRSVSSAASEARPEVGDSSGLAGSSDMGSSLPEWLTSSSRNRLPVDDSQGNSWCFRRAANLIRESLDLRGDGGVIFLEANNNPMVESDHGSDGSSDLVGPATVLSMSTNDEPFSPKAGSTVTCAAANLDRYFLHQLLRRYPKGKLWSFHHDGLISTSDDDDQPSDDMSLSQTNSRSPPGEAPPLQVSNPIGKRRKAAENAMLNQYFPDARQIMFVPLWNAANSQWFAGCFCWTTMETQVFSSAVELSSVLGFGSSIMAEYSRVESLIADRQKGDFIGSISHELRSPLHGILAAAEFLSSTDMNEFQYSLLDTVNACGRTLLDTMNQVLDFSKVVSLERTWRSLKRRKESPLDFKGTENLVSHLDSYVVTDLAILAEEVVECICLGHAYGQNSTASADSPVLLAQNTPKVQPSRSNVSVVIDVAHRDWIYRTQPGALRRIIMNVFGNAMKYTEAGRVTLRLEASSQSEGRSRQQGLEDLVTLTVSDTGKGISEEFLRGRLYTPFAQEDSLAVGTGLGLSIVRSLVKALNGNIRIRSRPGEGTVVRVSLPLARPVGEESPPVEPQGNFQQQREISTQAVLLQGRYPDKRAAIWGVDPAIVKEHGHWGEISRYLTEWYGFELVAWPSSTPVDILLADEDDLPDLRLNGLSETLPAVLIFCHKSGDYSMVRSELLPLSSSADVIRWPCGPHKLARSVLKCLQHLQSTCSTVTSVFKDAEHLPIRTSMPQSPIAPEPGSDPATTSDAGPRSYRQVAAEDSIETDKTVGRSPTSTEEAPLQTSSVITPLPMPLVEGAVKSRRLARVLVVEDNRINLNLMITFLSKRKLTTLDSAEDGKLAVEAVEQMQSGYDIIFMDLTMPVMNGFEATRAIRALERERDGGGHAVIIALTGLSSSRDESEALSSGVDLFLTKPVSFREVSRLLNEWEKDGLVSERQRLT